MSEDSKRSRRRKKRSRICFTFRDTGDCKYGDSCRFLHDAADPLSSKDTEGENETKGATTTVQSLTNSYFPLNHDGCEIFRPRGAEDRYFEQLYSGQHDIFVHLHSNGIGVIGLAQFHPALDRKKRTVKEISFLSKSKGKNLADFQVSGKRKKGGTWLDPTHPLCCIICSDGKQFPIHAAIRARLYEVNTKLETDPTLIYGKQGYLVVVAPKKDEIPDLRRSLLDSQTYTESARARPTQTTNANEPAAKEPPAQTTTSPSTARPRSESS